MSALKIAIAGVNGRMGRVLVEARGHRFGDTGGQIRFDGVVRKSLAYIDRAKFAGAA